MKRVGSILLLLLILTLCACGKKSPSETQPPETVPTTAETTVPVETEPEVEYVIAEIDGIPAVLETLNRGDTVTFAQSFDEKHYVVKLNTGYGLVEKYLIRQENQAVFEGWTGYTYHNAEFYDNYRLAGIPAQRLPYNTKVEVVDDLGFCLLVSYNGKDGYMKPESLSKNPHGSGENDTTPADSGVTGQDGGDIVLRGSANLTLLSTLAPQGGEVNGKAVVLADGTDVVLGYFDRGDKIPVIRDSGKNGKYTVYLEGIRALISDAYVRTEAEAPYAQWEGRSNAIASLYDNFWMSGSPSDRLNANTELTVLQELENCYLVEVNGVTGYIRKDLVVPADEEPATPKPTVPSQKDSSTTKPTEPSSSTPTEAPDSGDSTPETTAPPETKPAQGNTGSQNPNPEWTPPIL